MRATRRAWRYPRACLQPSDRVHSCDAYIMFHPKDGSSPAATTDPSSSRSLRWRTTMCHRSHEQACVQARVHQSPQSRYRRFQIDGESMNICPSCLRVWRMFVQDQNKAGQPEGRRRTCPRHRPTVLRGAGLYPCTPSKGYLLDNISTADRSHSRRE